MTVSTVTDPTASLGTERRRSPATLPGYNRGRRPVTKGRTRKPDPLPTDVISRLLDCCVPLKPGRTYELSALRLRSLIVVLWRSGMRISEALALTEHDLHPETRTVHIARGKGGRPRDVSMDDWAWAYIQPWLIERSRLPVGELFCVIQGSTAGRAMSGVDARRQMRDLQQRSGVRHRVHFHGFRHSFAVDLRREGMDLLTLQASLGHAHLGVTQLYLRGLPDSERIEPVKRRPAPMVPVALPTPRVA